MKRRDFIQSTALASFFALHFPKAFTQLLFTSDFSKLDFGEDFLWGVATAAYQIEGAHNLDGKSPSVWDTFSHKKGKIHKNQNGDIACDFYHRYPEDIELIRQMNFDVNRFSLAWTRIKPDGIGPVNQKGVDFYHRVIDTCLEKGLQPWITLYHWDLPQCLEDKGGWANRGILQWFGEYVDFCTKEYGDKVKNWMVLNEPAAFVGLGYMAGMHAPGKINLSKFKKAIHYTSLAQALGGRIIRHNVQNANVGTTFSVTSVQPKTNAEKHVQAAKRMDAILNRLFIEPALGMGYPVDGWKYLETLEKYFEPEDEKNLVFDFDFVGIQHYFRTIARHSAFPPIMWANQVPAKKVVNNPSDLTAMGWEVYPEGIYQVLKRIANYQGIKNIIVTENGSAWQDQVENGQVHDAKRIQYFNDYLAQVLKAKREGVPVSGYFVWSLLDNFEWAEGYDPRFGLIYVNFETQERIVKDSGLWFKEFLK